MRLHSAHFTQIPFSGQNRKIFISKFQTNSKIEKLRQLFNLKISFHILPKTMPMPISTHKILSIQFPSYKQCGKCRNFHPPSKSSYTQPLLHHSLTSKSPLRIFRRISKGKKFAQFSRIFSRLEFPFSDIRARNVKHSSSSSYRGKISRKISRKNLKPRKN